MKKNWVSLVAIALSIAAISISIVRVEPLNFNNGSLVGFIAASMGICAAIMVGTQIYSAIWNENRIKVITEEKNKELKYNIDSSIIRVLFRVEILYLSMAFDKKSWDSCIDIISRLVSYVIDLQDRERAEDICRHVIATNNATGFYNELTIEDQKRLRRNLLKMGHLLKDPSLIDSLSPP